ncbi:MAG: ribonuclease P protein component [Gammaproteobacteria bacterium]|nr:ribonuclease P protein component [Gammaproteobacteria bacterium]
MCSINLEKKVNTPAKRALRLSKTQRLRKPEDYRRVYQSNQWGGSAHHTFNVNVSASRRSLGVTVSKRVAKSAVVRNRIRRQIKEFYRARQFQLIGAELVITAKPSCAPASDDQRRESLELLWDKLLRWQRWYLNNHADDGGVAE